MKIIIINHTFQKRQFSKRWEDLAEKHKDWEITLLAPAEWTWGDGGALTFGFSESICGFEYSKDNFFIKTIRVKKFGGFRWISMEMISYIESYNPDVVYHIGTHTQESLMQILMYKVHHRKKFKVFAFSMRGPCLDLKHLREQGRREKKISKRMLNIAKDAYRTWKVSYLNKYCDAIFCHYPEALKSFRSEGFEGPILIQTQVGVDTSIFYPDIGKRNKMRDKLGISESYVFASAVRFNFGKGIMQVLDALPIDGDWKYLLIGSGTPEEVKAVRDKISQRGLSDNIILPGFVQWEDMANFWNAADCAIHFTQTTDDWVETFSLSLVQAMATKLPVIGSSSGSVPYQIGNDGIIVDEHDIISLHGKLQWIIKHKAEGREIGERLYQRTIRSFSTSCLNELFYRTVNQLLMNVYDVNNIDMANS